MELRYSILDPTGNITALAESPVAPALHQKVADTLMRLHPEVEQVGFLRPGKSGGLPELRMAGGEFCGNASMCAAALLKLQDTRGGETLRLRVSGVERPVEVTLRQTGADCFSAALQMPRAVEIAEREVRSEGLRAPLPLVRMEGISHLVVTERSPFFALLHDRPAAERAVRALCADLGADCLGLLFLQGTGPVRRMTPLVYVPGSGTVFWENSCASGSAAVGMLLAHDSAAPAVLSLIEPGGVLRVASAPESGETRLEGSVRLVSRHTARYG